MNKRNRGEANGNKKRERNRSRNGMHLVDKTKLIGKEYMGFMNL